ncbi:TonB-dependent receptor [Autumnicola musiva]|uniref:TonB-dependent receptor n=1 Tax=Autumnicola musiva TaxID=3075589 RepID=A0ABU3D1D8_9FLAO|nr:TonB-dependent receptor [Zunongwangia sp. F117]MDT0675231.1 TonB-dependent receptor [Zunongwangia sp. F117]
MRKLLVLALFLTSATIFAQGTITGTVIDSEMNSPLPGANVVVVGTQQGEMTNFDGNFSLDVEDATGQIRISFVGYVTKTVNFNVSGGNTQNLGEISLEPDSNALSEVVVTGVVDLAKDRQTPVAVSTIRSTEIQEKLGNQEFPEILSTTPSIYATKQGGGFGDSRITIRGFDTQNSAVMVNGIPVNDMENGSVYWSNWAGLSDVATAIQVQRGLGSSKLAVSSVGGTINVVTRSAERSEGGFVKASLGNDNYSKTIASYNTGLNDNGWSGSFLLSRTSGDGYVNGTEFEGYNYFIGVGYQAGEDHDFNFMLTGAPQQHNQRGAFTRLSSYLEYGEGGEPNEKYNPDYGYRNGEEFTFAGNFYHKPIASLSWEWDISSISKLSTTAYASFGRGGSIGAIGRINGMESFALPKTEDGLIPIDDIFAYNSGQNVPSLGGTREGYTGGGNQYQGEFVNGHNSESDYVDNEDYIYGSENGISQRSSVNSHNWFGLIANFETELNESLTLDVGADLRSYKGFHYRRLVDLMGADAYVSSMDRNNPYRFLTETYEPTAGNTLNVFKSIDDEEKIDYYNDGLVRWAGVFGQLEYIQGDISAFVQGSLSNQGFKRVEYFNETPGNQETDWENILGGNIKAGMNYNIDVNHNVFGNIGYYSKQPLFDAVYINFGNNLNPNLNNEQVFGVELGYGFRSQFFNANVNLYRTSWADRFESTSAVFNQDTPDEIRGSANLLGITQVHKGVEFDFYGRIGNKFRWNGMFSLGDWEYKDDITATYFDQNQNPIEGVPEAVLNLDGVKVGNAAQLTASLGADYQIIDNLSVDATYRYADNLYADFDATDALNDPDFEVFELPSFGLLDLGASYGIDLGQNRLNFRVNVNNVTDNIYISESLTNVLADPDATTYDGVNVRNNVFFGWGRTWNASVAFRF